MSGADERVIGLRLHCAAERALSLALVISASVTSRRPTSSSSVDLPLSLPLVTGGGIRLRALTYDWRRTRRASAELNGVRERVPRLRLHCAAARALSLALVFFGERDASPTDPELFGRSPAFSPPSPLILSLLDAGRSRADFLSGVRVALIGRDRPLLLTYFFAEGT